MLSSSSTNSFGREKDASRETPDRRMSVEDYIQQTSPHSAELTPAEKSLEGKEDVFDVNQDVLENRLVFPTVEEVEVEAPTQKICYHYTISKKRDKKRKTKNMNGRSVMKDFANIMQNNLSVWKSGAGTFDLEHDADTIGVPTSLWDMDHTKLEFPSSLTSKHRHILHGICESLNLNHTSSGTTADRYVTVSKEKCGAQGHNLSRAVYGSMHYDDTVEKQTCVSFIQGARREQIAALEAGIRDDGEVVDHLHLYESRNFHLETLANVPMLTLENIIIVDTEEKLQNASEHLKKGNRIAFDAEWHSYRSYYGVTCLLQLTRGDGVVFLVDTLATWNGVKQHLGPLFEDPQVIKVCLAGQQDVQFLLRDFGIVTRGCFDLQIAVKILENVTSMGYTSLLALCGCDASVLSHIDQGKTNVRVSDWRRRPLSLEMLEYASCDCYYLLPCHDILAHRLAQTWGLRGAVSGSLTSTITAMRSALDKASFKVTDWKKNKPYCAMQEVLKKSNDKIKGHNKNAWKKKRCVYQPVFGARNEKVLEALYAYRESQAWNFDESLHFIASADLLFHMAWKLPTTSQAVMDVISSSNLTFPEMHLAAMRPPVGDPLYKETPTLEAQESACSPWADAIKEALEKIERVADSEEGKKEGSPFWTTRKMWATIGATSILFIALRRSRK